MLFRSVSQSRYIGLLVVTTTNNQYIDGMIIRLNIPKGFGMQQANQQQGQITVLSDTSFSIDIDTTQMDPFLSLINAGTTDGSGAVSGTINTNVVPLSIGQSFTIGDELYLIISSSGAMYCNVQDQEHLIFLPEYFQLQELLLQLLLILIKFYIH